MSVQRISPFHACCGNLYLLNLSAQEELSNFEVLLKKIYIFDKIRSIPILQGSENDRLDARKGLVQPCLVTMPHSKLIKNSYVAYNIIETFSIRKIEGKLKEEWQGKICRYDMNGLCQNNTFAKYQVIS